MIQDLPIILAIHSDWGIALLRLVVGGILLTHGWPKIKNLQSTQQFFHGIGFHPGWLWGTVAAIVETVGGALLVLGVFVRPVAFFVLGQFAVILAWRLVRRDPLKAFELDLLIFAASVALITLGAGSFAASVTVFGF